MEQKDTPSLPNFSLYESITYGSLRPHLPDNNDLPAVEKRYEQHVYKYLPAIDPTKEIRIGVEVPPFVRYKDVALKEGDRLEITPIDENTLDVKQVGRIVGSKLHDIPSPFNTICAYYLFLIEEEHEGILSQFKNMLFKDPFNLKYNALICQSHLKLQQQQAKDYQQALLQIGFTNLTEHAPFYVLYVLLYYIHLQLKKLHDLFAPIVNSSLSPAEIAFNVFEAPAHVPPKETTKVQTTPQQPEQTDSRIPKWVDLFKDPKAADRIIALLKEDGIIAADNSWIKFPHVQTMIALYNVLLRKGYMAKNNEKAEVLAVAFNKQFNVISTSKKWQPKQRETADFHEDLFRLIPTCKP